ncbi:VOC family protein [Myroides odoratimimus]|uniref:VOC family protein n=1 Tax=Myroides odoratimimus TaxID=76832 RepID=UPI000468D043|nr:VOC family protein [Myroides odoratimimus]
MYILNLDIETNQLEETKAFYTEVLDFDIIEETKESFAVQAGETILTFKEVDNPVNVYHFAFNIPSNQIEGALIWSREHVDLIENVEGNVVTHFEAWKAKSIYFTDNNGNILEFIAREDILLSLNGPFDPVQITCISEIGVVVKQPMVVAEKLIEEYSLSYFKKAEPTEQFLALGDDQGLIIMVTPDRNWYPTNIPAKFTNSEMIVENNEMMISLKSKDLYY